MPRKARRSYGTHGTELTDDCKPLCGARSQIKFSGRAADVLIA